MLSSVLLDNGCKIVRSENPWKVFINCGHTSDMISSAKFSTDIGRYCQVAS
jgi:hypothetical protein